MQGEVMLQAMICLIIKITQADLIQFKAENYHFVIHNQQCPKILQNQQVHIQVNIKSLIIDKLDYSHRDRETLVQSSLNNKYQYASFVINQSHSESFINVKGPSTLVAQTHSQSRGLNPRQSKGVVKKKKRQPQIQGAPNVNKLQQAMKQHQQQQFKAYQQSSKKQSRSPLREHKSSVYSNINDSKLMKSNNKPRQQPASFLLTFNRDKDDISPGAGVRKSKQKVNKSSGKENKRIGVYCEFEGGIVNITNKEQKQRQIEEDKIRRQLHLSSSGKKRRPKSSQDKRYSSPSPNQARKSIHQSNSFYNNNKLSENHSHVRSFIGSGEKETPNRKSIDVLIKENLKKQKEQERKQLEKEEIKKEQESFRRQQNEDKNKEIREKNLQNYLLKLKKNVIKISSTIDHNNRHSKSPLRQQRPSLKVKKEQQAHKNRDMPLKVEANRRKDQLGLEIFDLKKELGMKSSIHHTSTVDHNQQQQQQHQNRPKSRINDQNRDDQEDYNNIHNRVRHIQPNPKLQKLISVQQRSRQKIQKKEKMQQLLEHFRVIENLKSLNKHCSDQRKKRPHKSSYFKTAQEGEEEHNQKTIEEHHHHHHHPHTQSRSKSKLKQYSPGSKNVISGRRSTLQAHTHRDPNIASQKQALGNKVVYSYISHNNAPIVKSKTRQGSVGKQKNGGVTKKKMIDMLIKQMEQQSESMTSWKNNHNKKKKSSGKSSNRIGHGQQHKKSIESPKKIQRQTKSQQNLHTDETYSPTRSARRDISNNDPSNNNNNSSSQVDSENHNNSQQSDNIQIDDEMMIFCVLTTAASIIQRNFREYLQRKLKIRQDESKLQQKSKNKSQQEKKDELQDSALLENRLLPSDLKDQQKEQVRKGPKHTFSFGNYDEHTMGHVPLQQQKQQQILHQSPILQRAETLSVDETRPQFQQQQQKIPQQDQRSHSKQQEQLHQEQQVEDDLEGTLENVLKINDKFKYALRNIAEKQKKGTLKDQIKKKKNESKSKSKEQTLNENRIQQQLNQHQIQQKHRISEEENRKKRFMEELNQQQLSPVKSESPQKHQQQQHQQQQHQQQQKQSQQQQQSIRHMSPLEQELQNLSKQPQAKHGQMINVQQNEYDYVYSYGNEHNNDNNKQNELSRLSIDIEQDDSSISDHNDHMRYSAKQLQININNNESQISLSGAEQTDKIICYSPINTNEEMLEAAVNQSNTLNNESILINESNLQQSRIEGDSQNNHMQVLSSEKGNYHSMLLEESKDDGKRYVKSEESEDENYTHPKAQLQKKPILRLMFGDEKFLLDHEDGIGSGPSSQRYQQVENPYFLATNASIFERNPFKEFTTNKLHEILSGKDLGELKSLKEDALKYQEKLEKGLINRMERRSELSPKSSQRKKYELESWVSAERKNIHIEKEHPVNVCDLEQERQEAAQIIEQVNRKAKDIKEKLQQNGQKPLTPRQSFKQQMQLQVIEIKEENQSKLEISEEEKDEVEQSKNSSQQQYHKQQQPLLEISNRIPTLEEVGRTEVTPIENKDVVLEISFEEDDDDDENEIDGIQESFNFMFEQNKKMEEEKRLKMLGEVDKITSAIFNDMLLQESQQLFPRRQNLQQLELLLKNAPSIQKVQVLEQEIAKNKDIIEEIKESQQSTHYHNNDSNQQQQQLHHHHNNLQQEKYAIEKSPLMKVQPIIIEQQIAEQTLFSRQSKPNMGIDTTDEATDTYVEEIFTQIRTRKAQFLQAFATPIYKNPMDVLNNLQKPEYGDMEVTMDMTSSLSCILNVQLYLTLEKAKENLIHETINQIKKQNLSLTPGGNQLTEEELVDVISEAQHIHNKVIFDCVNEALNSVRPYSYQGEPMPWSNKPRKNLMIAYENIDVLEHILSKVKTKVSQWTRTKAGALPFNRIGGENFSGMNQAGATMDEEHFASQREKCLAQLLAQDLIEGEEKWLDYEMEEAQVKIDLSDIVLEHLVGETCDILNNIQSKRLLKM